jgi:uncharacterized protein YdhG (YjbR/CyaY superfamily)
MIGRTAPGTIDEYIAAFPPDVRSVLKKIRATIKNSAPQATERISYRMPAFFQSGVLIYFAAFKNHIGIYPPVRGDEKLNRELAPYRGPKGNLKFPLDEPIPYGLIGRMVKWRVKEKLVNAKSKRSRKKVTI